MAETVDRACPCLTTDCVGFLTTFDIHKHVAGFERVLKGGLPMTIRMRLQCQVSGQEHVSCLSAAC